VEQADRHALDRYKDVRDQATENIFLGVYGSPVLQALVGLNTDGGKPRRIGRDIAREAASPPTARRWLAHQRGRLTEGIIRALLYIFRSPEMSAADERAFAAMRQLHLRTSDDKVMSVTTLKKILREQYLMLQVNEEAALNDLPLLLPEEPEARQQALGIVRQVAGATGTLTGEAATRLERIAASLVRTPKLAVVQEEGAAPSRQRLAHEDAERIVRVIAVRSAAFKAVAAYRASASGCSGPVPAPFAGSRTACRVFQQSHQLARHAGAAAGRTYMRLISAYPASARRRRSRPPRLHRAPRQTDIRLQQRVDIKRVHALGRVEFQQVGVQFGDQHGLRAGRAFQRR
jgi:hypothetical protein